MSLPVSRDMELDPGTFGGSPACHVLVDMLNKGVVSVRDKHKILSFITKATYNFKCLSALEDKSVRIRSMTLVKDDILSNVDKMPYSDKFKSYLKNVIYHHFRRYLREAI